MKQLWSPTTNYKSALDQFLCEINAHFNLELNDYHSLWKWSTEDVERFWAFWWQHADLIVSSQPDKTLLAGGSFKKDSWFPNARLNFAENLLRFRDDQPAIVFRGEDGSREELSYKELFDL